MGKRVFNLRKKEIFIDYHPHISVSSASRWCCATKKKAFYCSWEKWRDQLDSSFLSWLWRSCYPQVSLRCTKQLLWNKKYLPNFYVPLFFNCTMLPSLRVLHRSPLRKRIVFRGYSKKKAKKAVFRNDRRFKLKTIPTENHNY